MKVIYCNAKKCKNIKTFLNSYKVMKKIFSLSQNYPNPFNPTTKFTFTIPGSQQVTITVYDIMGREVKTLLNENKVIGKYTVSWDGTNSRGNTVSSLVYFYRLETTGFTDVKKMIFLK